MSVLEIAHLPVPATSREEFVSAFAEAKQLLDQAQGAQSVELTRSVTGDGYVLIVRWDTLADHIQGFVSSAAFPRFQELLWPHFAGDPTVEHFEEIAEGTE